MTFVKTEPGTTVEQPLEASHVVQQSGKKNSRQDGANVLYDKTNKSQSKQYLQNYILNTNKPLKDHMANEPPIKREIMSMKTSNENEEEIVQTKRTDSHVNKKFKKNESDDLSPPVTNPTNYKEMGTYLFEKCPEEDLVSSSNMLNELFDNISNQEELAVYKNFASMSIMSWIQTTDSMLSKFKKVLLKLIKLRLKLSYNFRIITDMINRWAENLIAKGTTLDAKLDKIKRIGNDILNLI
ncbi:hypothetical protein KAFR_0I01220 [Kazachstania africana CBS 2517]|uniref:Extracellular mutant protein 11 C-terminal domain-containing protein n=1 Tax=Kazachstania africana (strain ATCC 22294 / BCRC 22015 / CBS 2517 / CECT 1963 / NBRC 1671 / NRRL Y-8276) TaxID=1071382 RepID=H2AZV3_KAZAF|nr:hypothetical protein KAFR_0I01220 [Kazachstania africana CBS 2517]CCF59903.1 hypothetical protein KAFR_0I01220 [Kazachstania africana CBS 2517]